jgi:iron(III) transport system ATP-binding protein
MTFEALARPPTTAGAALAFENVVHAYGHVRAVEGVSFDVAPGEVVALLGQSGCGKTTLLRIAAGIERPTAGDVRLDGRIVSSGPHFLPPERRGVGLVFQDYALFPHMSVRDNVLFGLRALTRLEADRAVGAALERVGLSRLAASYPGELSGGEQQRAALARAVAPKPAVILMDEPFSGLDMRLRDAVREDTLAVLRDSGATVVMVTHDPEEAMRMADRIVLMRTGRVVQTGAPHQLYGAPNGLFAARFFSELNEIACEVRRGRASSAVGQAPAPGVPDGPAVLAVRPHAVRLVAAGLGVAGQIVARRFLGETEQVQVSIENLSDPLRVRARRSECAPVGSDVGVMLEPTETLVFAAADT